MKFDKLQWMLIKDTIMDVVESLPNIIWYAGWFFIGFVVGSW